MAITKKAILAQHVNRAAKDIRDQSKREHEQDDWKPVLSLDAAKEEAREYIEPISQNGPMDPKFKEKWLKALRSGRFRQATGNLKIKRDGRWGHCCLGVLSETDPKVKPSEHAGRVQFVFPLKGVMPDWDPAHHDDVYTDGAMMPSHFSEPRYGLKEDTLDNFAGLNDNGVTFETIAGIIEEYL